MRTSKAISSVSYNSPEFLKSKLDGLVNNHIIEFWAFICHKGEPTESEDLLKDHIHLYMMPNHKIDTMDLKDYFKEDDPKNPKLPLDIKAIKNSKFDEWYLYVLHDEDYLLSKGLVRFYRYSPDMFIASDYNTLEIKSKEEVKTREKSLYNEMEKYQKDGWTFHKYAKATNVHAMQYRAYKEIWNCVYMVRVEEQGYKEIKELEEQAQQIKKDSLENGAQDYQNNNTKLNNLINRI